MIARVFYRGEHRLETATLGDDGRWSAPAEIEAALNTWLASEDRSPARGNWPVGHARAVAEALGGTVHVAPKREPAGMVVY